MCGCALARTIGFGFERAVLHHRNTRPEWILDMAGTLLHDVRKLVAQELLAVYGVRVVLSRSEIQIRTMSKGQSADGRRLGADMDADIREAGAEKRFHFLQYGIGQWLPDRAAEVRQIRRQL